MAERAIPNEDLTTNTFDKDGVSASIIDSVDKNGTYILRGITAGAGIKIEFENKPVADGIGYKDSKTIKISSEGGGGEGYSYEKVSVTPYDNQTVFNVPNNIYDVLSMSINGIENDNFKYDSSSNKITFDPIGCGYSIDATDDVTFTYKI